MKIGIKFIDQWLNPLNYEGEPEECAVRLLFFLLFLVLVGVVISLINK